MKTSIFVLLGACLAAAPARAWEPKPEAVGQRISALKLAGQGKVAQKEALRRSKQGRKPAWAAKLKSERDVVHWSEVSEGKTYTFGVGMARGIKDRYLRVSAAQDRARAALLKALFPAQTTGDVATTQGTLAGSEIVDWYSDSKGSLYALAVIVR